MTFDNDELALVRSTVRNAIDSNEPVAVLGALAEAGWADLLEVDPGAAITALAEQTGAARSAAPSVDLAMMWGAGLPADPGTAVVYDGIVLAGAERAERFMVVGADGITAHESAAVTLAPAAGLDPAMGAQRASFDGSGEPISDPAATCSAIAAGRRALASQMVGAADQMLTDTLDYVKERHQYGRAIGSFQTVKHRLAEVKVATTAARNGTAAAWEAASGPDGPMFAIAAKCLAGRAHQLASTHCFQVHGGIAFTAEHGFQHWVRRGFVLDLLLGGHEQLTAELGIRLISAGQVPRHPNLY